MALQINTTGKTLVNTINPTTSDVSYTYKGEDYPIQVCTFWFNSIDGTFFFCTANDGILAIWKKFTLI